MSISVTLSFRWPMGHRILGLEGEGSKCRNIHGHNWTADVELPNDDGELEFGEVKRALGDWIEGVLDHGFLVEDSDPFRAYLMEHELKHYTIVGPPTTEAVCELLAHQCHRLLHVSPLKVHVLEGYRNAATWYQDVTLKGFR